jgi:hypothetical protein
MPLSIIVFNGALQGIFRNQKHILSNNILTVWDKKNK